MTDKENTEVKTNTADYGAIYLEWQGANLEIMFIGILEGIPYKFNRTVTRSELYESGMDKPF